jgi:hypothetical protein
MTVGLLWGLSSEKVSDNEIKLTVLRLFRIKQVKFAEGVEMLDILVRFLIRCSMASSFDEISDRTFSSSSAFRVKYFIDFIFILVIDDNRWRGNCALVLIKVRNRRFQKANMENRVYVHPCREFELICVGAHNFYYFEWAKILPVKLLRRALSSDVFGI